MPLQLGRKGSIAAFLIGAVGAAFLGSLLLRFLGPIATGIIGLFIGYMLYSFKASGMLGNAVKFAGVALAVSGGGSLFGF